MAIKKGTKLTRKHRNAIKRGIKLARARKAKASNRLQSVPEVAHITATIEEAALAAARDGSILITINVASGKQYTFSYTDAREVWEFMNTVFE